MVEALRYLLQRPRSWSKAAILLRDGFVPSMPWSTQQASTLGVESKQGSQPTGKFFLCC